MARLRVGQMVRVFALHKEGRPAIVLRVVQGEAIVAVAGSSQDLNPRRYVVRKGTLTAKLMGLSKTTYFCEDGLVVASSEVVEARQEQCPELVRREVEKLVGQKADLRIRARGLVSTSSASDSPEPSGR